jgi:V/A-type H+-transporting ATPase subunit A
VNLPTPTPEARVVGVTGNIVSIEGDGPMMKDGIVFVEVGDARLKGEVLRVQGRRADAQVYEETEGVRGSAGRLDGRAGSSRN